MLNLMLNWYVGKRDDWPTIRGLDKDPVNEFVDSNVSLVGKEVDFLWPSDIKDLH